MCRGIYSEVWRDAETEGCAIFVPLILGSLWPGRTRESRKTRKKRGVKEKKRKEEKAIKGKRIMGV